MVILLQYLVKKHNLDATVNVSCLFLGLGHSGWPLGMRVNWQVCEGEQAGRRKLLVPSRKLTFVSNFQLHDLVLSCWGWRWNYVEIPRLTSLVVLKKKRKISYCQSLGVITALSMYHLPSIYAISPPAENPKPLYLLFIFPLYVKPLQKKDYYNNMYSLSFTDCHCVLIEIP